MQFIKPLVRGYKNFLSEQDLAHFRRLAEDGQSPNVMVIACADSRVNPDLIFNAIPGDLFVVRNVANLVPPHDMYDAYHGTSAGIEFAVKGLGVSHIIIMGHSLCGGVKACCQNILQDGDMGDTYEYIPRWTSILDHCAERVVAENPDITLDALSNAVEQDAIRASLRNLHDFPFVAERIADGRLTIHGAYFDIKDAQLYALDQETDIFIPVE